MIKNLKSKLIICLFLLVTVFSVTSSCFADSTIYESPYSAQDFLDSGKFNTEIYSYDSSKFKYVGVYGSTYDSNYLTVIYDPNDVLGYVQQFKYGSNYYNRFRMYDKNNNEISLTYSQAYSSGSTFYRVSSVIQNNSTFSSGDQSGPIMTNLTTVKVLAIDGSVMYEPNLLGVDVTHEFQSDTSAKVNFTVNNAPEGAILKYSLTGVEISTDLTAPLQLRNPVIYTPRSNKFSC